MHYLAAAIALWFCLRLPSCGCGFKSRAHCVSFFQFVSLKLWLEKDENEQKEAGIGLEKNALLKEKVSRPKIHRNDGRRSRQQWRFGVDIGVFAIVGVNVVASDVGVVRLMTFTSRRQRLRRQRVIVGVAFIGRTPGRRLSMGVVFNDVGVGPRAVV